MWIVLFLSLVGAVAVPKLFWDSREVAMTCPDYENAMGYLEEVMDFAKDRAGLNCLPGHPECIAEGWMYSEALSLHAFLHGAYKVACQSL